MEQKTKDSTYGDENMKWTYTTRKINGKRCRAKVHKKSDGGYLVRKVGHRNRTD